MGVLRCVQGDRVLYAQNTAERMYAEKHGFTYLRGTDYREYARHRNMVGAYVSWIVSDGERAREFERTGWLGNQRGRSAIDREAPSPGSAPPEPCDRGVQEGAGQHAEPELSGDGGRGLSDHGGTGPGDSVPSEAIAAAAPGFEPTGESLDENEDESTGPHLDRMGWDCWLEMKDDGTGVGRHVPTVVHVTRDTARYGERMRFIMDLFPGAQVTVT